MLRIEICNGKLFFTSAKRVIWFPVDDVFEVEDDIDRLILWTRDKLSYVLYEYEEGFSAKLAIETVSDFLYSYAYDKDYIDEVLVEKEGLFFPKPELS